MTLSGRADYLVTTKIFMKMLNTVLTFYSEVLNLKSIMQEERTVHVRIRSSYL